MLDYLQSMQRQYNLDEESLEYLYDDWHDGNLTDEEVKEEVAKMINDPSYRYE